MANKANSRICLVTSILLLLTLCTSTMGKTIYVDDDAAGANDGSSWPDAYNYLQDALADANSADKPTEIRVAQGIYRPNQGILAIPDFDWRTATFQLINGVSLKGGYAGFGELDPDARDIEVYKSILTGDLNGDDVEVSDPCDLLSEPTRSENSYHVVTGSDADETAAIDGFVITAGNANGPESADPNSNGAGLYNFQSSPTVINCVFTGNSARWSGAGMHNICSSPVVINCTFNKNSAGTSSGGHGGGMYNSVSDTMLTNCTFAFNSAPNGNALACSSSEHEHPSNVEMTNCIVWDGGDEIWNEDGSTITINYSTIQAGQAGIFDPCEAVIWGGGNIDVDPLLADPNNGDYHLKSEAGRWDPLSESWVIDDVSSPCIDAGDPNSDWSEELWPHGERINMGAYGGTSEASMSLSDAGKVVYIQWLGHASVNIWTEDVVVYVDPRNLSESLHDATLVLVTHIHGDHYSPADIARVSNPETQFIAPPDVVQQYGSGEPIAPGQTIELDSAIVTALPAYNINKPYHPKSNNWVGYIIEIASKRIYVAGDTDLTEEMKALEDIDVAILPAGGTYTMNAVEAAEATQYIKPELAIPYHWGDIIGSLSDAETFAQKAVCAVKILTVGETISSDNWLQYSPLIAYWKLDETEGSIAYDSAGGVGNTLDAVSFFSGLIDDIRIYNQAMSAEQIETLAR